MIFVVLASNSPYSCYPGAGESGTSLAQLEDYCGRKECEKKCNSELLCKGFDFLRTNAKCSCRLFPENTPRKIDDGSNPRQYCEKKRALEKGNVVLYSQISIDFCSLYNSLKISWLIFLFQTTHKNVMDQTDAGKIISVLVSNTIEYFATALTKDANGIQMIA